MRAVRLLLVVLLATVACDRSPAGPATRPRVIAFTGEWMGSVGASTFVVATTDQNGVLTGAGYLATGATREAFVLNGVRLDSTITFTAHSSGLADVVFTGRILSGPRVEGRLNGRGWVDEPLALDPASIGRSLTVTPASLVLAVGQDSAFIAVSTGSEQADIVAESSDSTLVRVASPVAGRIPVHALRPGRATISLQLGSDRSVATTASVLVLPPSLILPTASFSASPAPWLPAAVALALDTTYQATLPPVTLSFQLGDVCANCVFVAGSVAPKPAFNITFKDTLRLPSEIAGATLVDAPIDVGLTNGFSFDPVRPSATGPRGDFRVTWASGSVVLATAWWPGEYSTVPAHGMATQRVQAAGEVATRSLLALLVTSPEGDPVRIDPTEPFTVTATARLRASALTLAPAVRSLDLGGVRVDATSLDSVFSAHVTSVDFAVRVTNPVAATGTVVLHFGATTRPVPVPADGAVATVTLTGAEARDWLQSGSPDAAGVTATFTTDVTTARMIPFTRMAVSLTPTIRLGATTR